MSSAAAPGDSLAREKPVEPPFPDMVWIPGGTFRMGSDQHYAEEAPVHRVTVDGFWIDAYPVTNSRFREFVEVTGHTTFAEIPPNPEDYPGAIPEMMFAGSLVFEKPPVRVDLRDSRQWWSFVRGADWLHPRGAGSNLRGLNNHPVVHVAYSDAEAFATWSGKVLPTEAEWEFAARGHAGRIFPWGNLYNPHLANHGSIALDPTDATDGFAGLAPVGSIRDGATPLGLLDMAGNAAEWVADEVDSDANDNVPLSYPPLPQINPRATGGNRRVIRGGSYLRGADSMRATARTLALGTRRAPDVGFRCAADESSD